MTFGSGNGMIEKSTTATAKIPKAPHWPSQCNACRPRACFAAFRAGCSAMNMFTSIQQFIAIEFLSVRDALSEPKGLPNQIAYVTKAKLHPCLLRDIPLAGAGRIPRVDSDGAACEWTDEAGDGESFVAVISFSR